MGVALSVRNRVQVARDWGTPRLDRVDANFREIGAKSVFRFHLWWMLRREKTRYRQVAALRILMFLGTACHIPCAIRRLRHSDRESDGGWWALRVRNRTSRINWTRRVVCASSVRMNSTGRHIVRIIRIIVHLLMREMLSLKRLQISFRLLISKLIEASLVSRYPFSRRIKSSTESKQA